MKAVIRMAFVVVVVVACLPSGGQAQQLSTKQKVAEKRAISAFAAGHYEDAVTIYSDLYADYRDPIYLRNIGRCYQKLKDPDKAIASFEEYLNKGKSINAEERQEIAGYMEEMRALQGKKAGPSSPPPGPAPATVAPASGGTPGPAPLPIQTSPSFPTTGAAPYPPSQPAEDAAFPGSAATGLAGELSKPPLASNDGIRWVGKGALILSGVSAAVSGALLWASWSTYHDKENGKCLTQGPNECSSAADSIDAMNLWSGITLGLAVVSAAAGGTILYLYPSSPSADGLQAGLAWTY